jgi:hypothetical protein
MTTIAFNMTGKMTNTNSIQASSSSGSIAERELPRYSLFSGRPTTGRVAPRILELRNERLLIILDQCLALADELLEDEDEERESAQAPAFQ